MAALKTSELEELSRFLAERSKGSLFDYLELAEDADDEVTEETIAKKRRWAQGQQANPKFRSEALWVIKNSRLLRRALGEGRESYRAELARSSTAAAAVAIGPFIQGILAAGSLTAQGEAAIRERGVELGLSAEQISAEIEAWLEKTGATRGQTPARPSDPPPLQDWYALLEVDPNDDAGIIEQAYRRKYRWARQLRDPQRANQIYVQLDEAWRVLKTAAGRKRYDAQRLAAVANNSIAATPELELSLGEGGSPALRFQSIPDPTEAETVISRPNTPTPTRRPQPAQAAPQNTSRPVDPSDTTRRNRVAPRPPETLEKVAMEVAGGARPRRRDQAGPKLVVDGSSERQIQVGSKPTEVHLVVRNTGEGQLQGTVHADRDWVDVSPSTLDPTRRQQTVTVTIHPNRMPRRQAVCYIGISANRGQRASVTLEVSRPDRRPLWAGLAAVALIGLAVLAWALGIIGGSAELVPPKLDVQTDPPGAAIFIDGELESSNGTLSQSEALSPDTPIEVRVELDGFETWTKTVTIPSGQSLELSPVLVLTDHMEMLEIDDSKRGEIDMDGVKNALSDRRVRLEACLADHAISSRPGTTLGLRFRVRVRSTGTAAGYVAEEREGVKESVDDCVKRELRAIRYPMVPGEYGEFSYGLRGNIPDGPGSSGP